MWEFVGAGLVNPCPTGAPAVTRVRVMGTGGARVDERGVREGASMDPYPVEHTLAEASVKTT